MATQCGSPGTFYCTLAAPSRSRGLILCVTDTPDKDTPAFYDFYTGRYLRRSDILTTLAVASPSHIRECLEGLKIVDRDHTSPSVLAGLSADIQDALLAKASRAKSGRSADYLRAFREASETVRDTLKARAKT